MYIPGSDGKATTAAGCTMDNQLIFDLWTAIISASQILDIDQEFASHLTQRLKEMAPMQVGHWGQLQEWMFDWDDPNDVHRHVSHLYGLFPSNQISPYRTPELFDAARTSPDSSWRPVRPGGAWDGKFAFGHASLMATTPTKLITDQLTLVRNEKKKEAPTLTCSMRIRHFKLMETLVVPQALQKMLMQSYDGFIYLLPALPTIWKDRFYQRNHCPWRFRT